MLPAVLLLLTVGYLASRPRAWALGGLSLPLSGGRGRWRSFAADAEERPSARVHRSRKARSKGVRKILARSSPGHLRFVAFLVVVGAVLRVLRINDPITYDEAFAFTGFSAHPVGEILSNYISPVNHVLHTLLVKFSTGLFGVHLWSLRLPALLAGIAVLPAFYLLVRQLFNRYIALIALSLVAVSGPLVEYSALARGYSLSWLFLVLAMIAGRHYAKSNGQGSAALVALFLALGMWAVPSMMYGALMVYVWLLLYILANYSNSRTRRNAVLLLSLLLFFLFTFVFYAGVVMTHGIAPLLRDPSLGDGSWKAFVNSHADRVLDLWAYFMDSASAWLAVLGWMGVIYSAYVSTKYRQLLFGLAIGAIPLVVAQHVVGLPRVWTYSLFIFHLGSAIAVFYLLKFVQEKLVPQLGKQVRTGLVSVLLLVLFGVLGLRSRDEVERFPEAAAAAHWCKAVLKPGDRLMADLPWDAPLEFHLRAEGVDPGYMQGASGAGGRLYVAVGTASDHTPRSVLDHFGLHDMDPTRLVKLEDWHRLEIFAAP